MGPNRQKKPDNRRCQRGGRDGSHAKANPVSPAPTSMMITRDNRDMIIDVLHHAASRGVVPVPDKYFDGSDTQRVGHVVTLQRNTRLAPRDVLQRVFEGLGFPQDLVTQYLIDVLHAGTFPDFVDVADLLDESNTSNQTFVVNSCFDLFKYMTQFEQRCQGTGDEPSHVSSQDGNMANTTSREGDLVPAVDCAGGALAEEMETVRVLFGESLVELLNFNTALDDEHDACGNTSDFGATSPNTNCSRKSSSNTNAVYCEACFRFTTCDDIPILVVIRFSDQYPCELPTLYLQPFRAHTSPPAIYTHSQAEHGLPCSLESTHETAPLLDKTLTCYPLCIRTSDALYLNAATRRAILDDAIHILRELRGGPCLLPLLSTLHGQLSSLSRHSSCSDKTASAAAAAAAAAAEKAEKQLEVERKSAQRRAFMQTLTSYVSSSGACAPMTENEKEGADSSKDRSTLDCHKEKDGRPSSIQSARMTHDCACMVEHNILSTRATVHRHHKNAQVAHVHSDPLIDCDSQAALAGANSIEKQEGPNAWCRSQAQTQQRESHKTHGVGDVEDDDAISDRFVPYALPSKVEMHTIDTSTRTAPRQHFLRHDAALDDILWRSWNTLRRTGTLSVARTQLPAYAIRSSLQQLLTRHDVVVIGGETGSGKTTQIPQYLYEFLCEQRCGSRANILCTQPRRLAATSVAMRVAEERDEAVGCVVGYSIRLERCVSRQTQITYCTTGMVLRQLQSDHYLGSVSHVVVDEIHERGVDTDFLLILLRDLLQRRNDLKVILMSATMDSELFARYFGGAPVLSVRGRTFPVQVLYLEQIIPVVHYVLEENSVYALPGEVNASRHQHSNTNNSKSTNNGSGALKCRNTRRLERLALDVEDMECALHDRETTNDGTAVRHDTSDGAFREDEDRPSSRTMEMIAQMNMSVINYELIECVVLYIENELRTDGAVLIFMPGMAEIMRCMEQLQSNAFLARRCIFYNLHSSLGSAEQQHVFQRPPRGKRKVIIGTNIMETSITIDDAVYVIDSGKAKENRYHAARALSELTTVEVSRANCRQREGRAGRVRSGYCFRLFTEAQFSQRAEHALCEMHRVPLESLVLQIYALHLGDEVEYLSRALTPPEERSIKSSVQVLTSLGALTSDKRLTSLGQHLSTLPLDVRIGKMIIHGSLLQCVDPVLTIAACLSVRSPFVSSVELRREVERVRRAFAKDFLSDQLSAYFAYQLWITRLTRCGAAAARRLCEECFLSFAVLQQIQSTKKQYERHLCEAGFLDNNYISGSGGSAQAKDTSARAGNVTRAAHANQFLFPAHVTLDDKIYEAGGQHFNANSDNTSCVLACLVAGLYPNVARIAKSPHLSKHGHRGAARERSGNDHAQSKTNQFVTWDGVKCLVHPSSVVNSFPRGSNNSSSNNAATPLSASSSSQLTLRGCANVSSASCSTPQLVVYVDKIRTSGIFLREVSVVTPMHVILFGGGAMRYDGKYAELCVDDATAFRCTAEEAALLIHIKSQLDSALTRKINDPNQSWESVSSVVVRAIVKLLGEDAKRGNHSFAVIDRRQPHAPVTAPLMTLSEQNATNASAMSSSWMTTGMDGDNDHSSSTTQAPQPFVTCKCCFVCGEGGHVAQYCPHGPKRAANGTPSIRCFICGQWHYPQDCTIPLHMHA